MNRRLVLLMLIFLLGCVAGVGRAAMAQDWVCKGRSGCASPGTVCTDGTIFVGCPAPGYTPRFAPRCDAGRTWGGASCGGVRLSTPWNNGNAANQTNPITNYTDGAANTTLLVATDSDSGTGGTQPHQAAAHCDGLTIHGYSDWYLGSSAELSTALLHLSTATQDVQDSQAYWTSSANGITSAVVITGGMHISYGAGKNITNGATGPWIRCLRKD